MDTKGMIQSKTIWGAIIMLGNAVAKHFGYDLGDVAGWVDVLVNLAGAGLAVYGRVKAVKPISGVIK